MSGEFKNYIERKINKGDLSNIKRNDMLVFLCVFLTYFAAHAYGILNPMIAHDSMSELNLFGYVDYAGKTDYILKLQAGRFTEVLYQCLIRGKLSLPWLTGVLSFVWITLFAFSVIRLFRITDIVQILLICGLLATNITVTSTLGTYAHDADTNFFGLLLGGLSALCWREKPKHWAIYGTLLTAFCLGCYQSYLSVPITLLMIVCIMNLMQEKDAKEVFRSGIQALGMFFAGGVLYLVLLLITTRAFHTTIGGNLGTFAQIKMPLANRVFRTYYRWLTTTMGPVSLMPHTLLKGISLSVAAAGLIAVIEYLADKNQKLISKLLIITLFLLLPIGMNLTYLLCPPGVTELSSYAYWMFFLLCILLVDWLFQRYKDTKTRIVRCIGHLLLAVLVWGNIQTANAAYLLREFQISANHSIMTRVTMSMESTEGYEAGITPVLFIGAPELDIPSGFERVSDLTGLNMGGPMSGESRGWSYYSYYLGKEIPVVEDFDLAYQLRESEAVQKMPIFPEKGFIKLDHGILIVKLGEVKMEE